MTPTGTGGRSPVHVVWTGFRVGLVGRAVGLVVGFLASVLAARLLSPAEFGRYATVVAMAALARAATASPLQSQSARLGADQPTDHAAGLLLGGVGSVLFLTVASAMGVWSTSAELVWTLAVVVALSGPVAKSMGQLRSRGRPAQTMALDLVGTTVRFGLLAGLALVGVTLSAVSLARIDVAAIVMGGAVALAVGRSTGVDTGQRREHRRVLRRGFIGLAATTLGTMALKRLDLLILARMAPADLAGQYAVTLRVSEMAFEFYGAALIMLLPTLSDVDDGAPVRAVYRFAVDAGARLLLPALILFALWGGTAVGIVFGDDYRVAPAVYALLALGIAAQVLTGPSTILMVSRRRHSAIVAWTGSAAVTLGVIAWALIGGRGMVGAAVASAAGYVTLNAGMLFSARRHLWRDAWPLRVRVSTVVRKAIAPAVVLGVGGVAKALPELVGFAVASSVAVAATAVGVVAIGRDARSPQGPGVTPGRAAARNDS